MPPKLSKLQTQKRTKRESSSQSPVIRRRKTSLLLDDEELDEEILGSYLDLLDIYQSAVYNIRMMHHAVWKQLRPTSVIQHDRAGSRVERQVRIHTVGGESDVDYKLIVTGIKVNVTEGKGYEKGAKEKLAIHINNESFYGRGAYGIVYCSHENKRAILTSKELEPIFSDAIVESYGKYTKIGQNVLVPEVFKENTVKKSGMEMSKPKSSSAMSSFHSPAISGTGANNACDAVPCLQLSDWPSFSDDWISRDINNKALFSMEWRERICSSTPLYIVPTANHASKAGCDSYQWRLSFTFVEKECFSRIYEVCPKILKLYGLAKFVFKTQIEPNNIFSSYHLKMFLLWHCEKWDIDAWHALSPFSFAKEMLSFFSTSLQNKHIEHFFIPHCNIFPKHKRLDQEKFQSITNTERSFDDAMRHLYSVMRFDLGVDHVREKWISDMKHKLGITEHSEYPKTSLQQYIDGYLTRLASACVYSLHECYQKKCLERCKDVFLSLFYQQSAEKNTYPIVDSHVQRIASFIRTEMLIFLTHGEFCAICCTSSTNNHVNTSTNRQVTLCTSGMCQQFCNDEDDFSFRVHKVFCAYTSDGVTALSDQLSQIKVPEKLKNVIGITITKFHTTEKCQRFHTDEILCHVMQELISLGKKDNRFYMHPTLLLKHLQLQKAVHDYKSRGKVDEHNNMYQNTGKKLVDDLIKIVEDLSDREPYIGKLSYKYCGRLLLAGYIDFFAKHSDLKFCAIKHNISSPEDIAGVKRFSTNFDLK